MDNLNRSNNQLLDEQTNITWISQHLKNIEDTFAGWETDLATTHKRNFIRFFTMILIVGVLTYFVSLLFQDESVRSFLQSLVVETIGAAILFIFFEIYWREKEKSFRFVEKGVQLYKKVYDDGNQLIESLKELEKQDQIKPDLDKHKRLEKKIQEWREAALKLWDFDWE